MNLSQASEGSSISSVAIDVSHVSKSYRIWRDPKARLKSPILRTLGAAIGALPFPAIARLGEFIRNHTREYSHDFAALHGVSFQVRAGEAVGIIGLNGSGKSTLLQILAGVLQPSEGSFRVNGRVAALLELGAGFNGEFTGRENVFLNAAILGISRAEMEQRFASVAAFAEIGEYIDQPVNTYSSGMVVRLAFAVLTQIEPDILIIDEALSVGDAYFQHKCARKIREFREQNKTLLFVSHDPGAIKSICDRALLLDKGIIVREGTATDVLDYYNAIVAKKEKDEKIRQVESESGRTLTRSGNGRATIVGADFVDASNRPARAFVSGDHATLIADIKVSQELDEPCFGLLIRDRLGMDVFGTNTYHARCAIEAEPGQGFRVRAHIELRLSPGSYSITIAVHAGPVHTGQNYDWIDNVIAFQVLPNPAAFSIGIAALPCAFEVERHVQPPNGESASVAH